MKITITHNGRQVALDCDPTETLLDVLRGNRAALGPRDLPDRHLRLVHRAARRRAGHRCLTMVAQADGRELTTVEGLGGAHPVQLAFIDAHALQCGSYTPGFVLTTKTAARREPGPKRRADHRGAQRQPLPLRLVCRDHRRRATRRRGNEGGAGMKLVTYEAGSGPRVGVMDGEHVLDAGFDGDMVGFIEAGAPVETGTRIAGARLLAPLQPRTLRDFSRSRDTC
jgi:aerobic-type carbon monoxide dehydrogenase small subunit (CoxS/CutS family)